MLFSGDVTRIVSNNQGKLMDRLRPLDTLRGIAALIVALFTHYRHFDHGMSDDAFPLYNVFSIFYDNGWNMVDLFFVLSGVVFSYVYGKKIKDGKIEARGYTVFRFSRLYPLHLATLLFITILFLFGISHGYGIFVYGDSNVKYFVANVFFIQSGVTPWPWTFNGPTWSISCEIVAYILFFIIMKYFYDKRLHIALTLIVVGTLFRHLHTNSYFVNSDIGRLFMGFFMGIVIYEALFSKRLTQPHFYLIIAALLLAFGGSVYIRPSAWSYPAVVFLYPAIIIASIRIELVNKILSLRFLTYLGDISYSVYLLHFPVQLTILTVSSYFALHFPYTHVGFLCAYGATVILVSVLSYEFFEKPIQTILRKRLLKRESSAP